MAANNSTKSRSPRKQPPPIHRRRVSHVTATRVARCNEATCTCAERDLSRSTLAPSLAHRSRDYTA